MKNSKTIEEKLGYLGNFSSYIPSDLLDKPSGNIFDLSDPDVQDVKAYIGYDNENQTYKMYPESTIGQELFNDSSRYMQYRGRFLTNFALLEKWAQGSSTAAPFPKYDDQLPSLKEDENMPVIEIK